MTVTELQAIGWKLMSPIPLSFDGVTLFFMMADPMGVAYMVQCNDGVESITVGEARVLH